MKLVLKNAKRLSSANELKACEVLIEGNKITRIAASVSEEAAEVIDCGGNVIVPGFIDVHIHLREPGGEHKETIASGTKAAARGGFTTVCAMPNTNPVPDNKETVKELLEKINQDALVRVLPYAAITKKLNGEERTDIAELAKMGVFAFTDDGVGIQTADTMLQTMKQAAANGMPVVAHCEDNSIIYGGVVHDGRVSKELNLPGIPSLSESVQIARDVLLAEATGCHYHVCHVSTKESVRVIRDAKKANINVTAEVTPHHLLMNEDDITTNDTNFKMNPPLRAKEDQEALLEGLLDGTLDFIATDHAPHAEEEKEKGFLKAPFGIVGLETAFSLLYTKLVKTNKITLKQLINYLTIKPSNVFNLPYGTLEENAYADLTVLDLEKETKIDKERFYSKGKNSPFHNWEITGLPILTVADGSIVYKEGFDG
ncbi:dihydroorotase [Virgibacillus natechei]|uniref:Dihydroorotase n=1 Tax=Virgibacillus natechei TaxID=1216297 RepID=A0ABS4IB98_9BACI|nr:dihydroorotase [Virgibacillus natechei]MBP1968173.1 dihydroorotase [Virgibacillus natechei]UZD14552.1 dihydroorotase [Virgibacillus natechei]